MSLWPIDEEPMDLGYHCAVHGWVEDECPCETEHCPNCGGSNLECKCIRCECGEWRRDAADDCTKCIDPMADTQRGAA